MPRPTTFTNARTWPSTHATAGFCSTCSQQAATRLIPPAGNLTYDGRHTLVYDAWNRMVAAQRAYRDASDTLHANVTVMACAYDGLGRRITKALTHSGYLDNTTHFYHDDQRTIETRNGSDIWTTNYVLGLQYIDELIQIKHNTTSAGTQAITTDDDEYFALHDTMYSVIGIVDPAGDLVERYEYTPYGQRTVFKPVDTLDTLCMAPSIYSQPVASETAGQFRPFGLCEFGHQGLMHDETVNLIYNRARMLSPTTGRFMQRDPIGYPDGMNAYAAHHVMRGGLDASGMKLCINPS